MRKENTALWSGATTWVDNGAPESVLSFTRNAKWENVLVVVNTRNAEVDTDVFLKADKFSTMLAGGATYRKYGDGLKAKLAPYGYLVVRYE